MTKKTLVHFSVILLCLASLSLRPAEKDAQGCKDHPLAPRMEGYYIIGCNDSDAVADFDLTKGGTVHVEGKSRAVLYDLQPGAKKPTEAGLKTAFASALAKLGGTQAGATPGQKWPAYKLARDGKEYWVVLMVDPGEYFTGSYGVRVIEKK